MRVHDCPACGADVWFDNLHCACGAELFYDPLADAMRTFGGACGLRGSIGCNWIREGHGDRCLSCAMTRTIPDLAVAGNHALWARAEAAKRLVLAGLLRLGWFTASDTGPRPVFDLCAEATRSGPASPVMGHADTVITINVAEAEPAEIVARRESLAEPYRTMVGHIRHELAHYVFARRASDAGFLGRFRAVFGDETQDYGAALDRYYASRDDGAWRDRHISRYASAHPHEDWAETAAHAMHLGELSHSARAVGLAGGAADELSEAIALAIKVNHLNRALGVEDPYPFVISPPVRDKLRFALDALARPAQAGTE